MGVSHSTDEKQKQNSAVIVGEGIEAEVFSSLSENEFLIVQALHSSKHAISARTIQGQIALKKILDAGLEPPWSERITNEKKGKQMYKTSIQGLIELARQHNFSVPSYTTITQLLNSLKQTPLVGEREAAEGERAEYIYFLKAAARAYADKTNLFTGNAPTLEKEAE